MFGADHAGQNQKQAIYTIDARGVNAPKPLAQIGRNTHPSVSFKGDQIAFISDQTKAYAYEVWRVRPDGTTPVQVTRNGSYNICPRFTPDGRQILFLSDSKRLQEFELWQVGADGSEPRRIADNGLFDNPLGWKP